MKRTMTLTVNDFPCEINNKLTQRAKKAKVSKNEYLTTLLTKHTLSEEIDKVKNDYEEILKLTLMTIEKNSEFMDELIKILRGD